MMDVSVRANASTKRVLLSVGKLGVNSRRAIQLGMKELGANLVKTTKDAALNEPKYGKLYKLRSGQHRASAPGQTPAMITGDYRESISYLQSANEIEFGSDVPYAKYLEDGTKKMKKRPGLRNSIDSNARNFTTYMYKALEKQLQI